MNGPILRGTRVTLRPVRGTDAHRLFRWRNSEAVAPFVMAGSRSVEEERQRIRNVRTLKDRVLYVIETKAGTPIGTIGLHGFGDASRRLGIGIMIGEANEQGRGYGRAAMELLIHQAFTKWQTHKIWLEVFGFHRRAQKLYASLGFKKEGVLREHFLKGGVFVDQWRMGLLDREWKARKKTRTL